uniref:Putative ATP synthase a chain n=1 Tax=uncultured bacterium CBNPD1 BAC clone 543 TaxID=417308 RepID=B1N6I8_9BACT|nr:putative ATP synthase a chain [uncultured bacterium CBNPD1 BAC clone 543]
MTSGRARPSERRRNDFPACERVGPDVASGGQGVASVEHPGQARDAQHGHDVGDRHRARGASALCGEVHRHGSRVDGQQAVRHTVRVRGSDRGHGAVLARRDARPGHGRKIDSEVPALPALDVLLHLGAEIIGLIPFVEVQEFISWRRGEQFNLAENTTLAIFGGAATASISVTGGMAVISFVLIQVQGFRELGVKGWLEHLCGGHDLVGGSPLLYPVALLVFVVEFFGLFVKPAALAIRLFANMVAGHTLLIVFTSFGALAANAGLGWFGVSAITVVSAVGSMLITLLEVFVALLQAFVFMFLTAVFISLMAHEDHGQDEAHGEDAAHAHGAPAH